MMSQVLTVFDQITVFHHLEVTVTSTYVQTRRAVNQQQNAAWLLCGENLPRGRAAVLGSVAVPTWALLWCLPLLTTLGPAGPWPSVSSAHVLLEVQRETPIDKRYKPVDSLLLVSARSSVCQPGEGQAGQGPSTATQAGDLAETPGSHQRLG